jgi:hypothetical protein
MDILMVSAELISVIFKDAVLPGGNTTPLPFLLTNADRNVYLRFSVPDFDRIIAINSVDVTFRLYDDGDGGDESGIDQAGQNRHHGHDPECRREG